MKLEPKWVFCAGMQRSGSTLQYQLTAALVEQSGLGRRVDWVPASAFPDLMAQHVGTTEWLVFKNHFLHPAMAQLLAQGEAQAVTVYRDLRDVMLSMMRKRDLPFNNLFDHGFLWRCVVSHHAWRAKPGVLVSRYETMSVDLAGEVRRIAAHLAIPCSDSLAESIAAQYTLERQRRRLQSFADRDDLQKNEYGAAFEPQTLLHTNHIYEGGSGQWRTGLARWQVALIEASFGQWLRAHDYPLTLTGVERNAWRAAYKVWRRLPSRTSPPG